MNILIGLSCGLVFFLCLIAATFIGYKLSGIKTKQIETKLTEKEILEHKKRMEGMQNIMNYDLQKAMGVKHE